MSTTRWGPRPESLMAASSLRCRADGCPVPPARRSKRAPSRSGLAVLQSVAARSAMLSVMAASWKQTLAAISAVTGATTALATFMGGVEKRLGERIDRVDTGIGRVKTRIDARLDEVSDRLIRLEGAVLPVKDHRGAKGGVKNSLSFLCGVRAWRLAELGSVGGDGQRTGGFG